MFSHHYGGEFDMGMLRYIWVGLIVVIILSGSTQTVNVQSNKDLEKIPWACDKGNERRTGLSPYDTSGLCGEIKWKLEDIITSPVVDYDGTLYVGDIYGNFYAIYPNGSIKWKISVGDVCAKSPSIGKSGLIFVGTFNGLFYAISRNGTIVWKKLASGTIVSSPVVDDKGNVYFCTTYNNNENESVLYAMDSNGTIKWKIEFKPLLDTSPSLYIPHHTLYLLCNSLYAIDFTNGNIKWIYNISSCTTVGYTVAIDKYGIVYAVGRERESILSFSSLYAIYPNGTLKWKYEEIGLGIDSSPSIGPDDTIYVSGMSTKEGHVLCAISPDGKLKWKLLNVSINGYDSAAIGADGTIYLGSDDGYFYAISPNGKVKWKLKIGKTVSSPAIGPNNTIYVAAKKDLKFYLYAIACKERINPSNFQMIILIAGISATIIAGVWLWRIKVKKK